MREILFRGKRVDNGEWVKGFYVEANLHWHNKGVHKEWIVKNVIQNGGWCNVTGKYAVIPETVGQYTGVTDKNGTKIFEGDIMKDEWGRVYEVFYTLDSCSFMVRCSRTLNEYEKGNYHLGKEWCETIRVIGNIHDSQDLTKGE